MFFNKGAMFGLDARIALAIFGALSVISGAALYSAIQQSKVTKVVTQLQEIQKAWSQFYLDAGEPLKCISHLKNKDDCEQPGFTGVAVNYQPNSTWNGPYIDYEVMKGDFPSTFFHTSYADEEGEQPHLLSTRCDDNTKTCYQFITLNIIGSREMLPFARLLNEEIDGEVVTGDSDYNGDFRFHIWDAAENLAITYRLGKYK